MTEVKFSDTDIQVIRSTLLPDGTSDDELNMFLKQCERTGLDPLQRQIYATRKGDKGKLIVGTTIDGFRLIAERTGKYAGQLGPQWCGQDGEWSDVWLKDTPPYAARVGVIRTDWREPLWAVAKYKGYVQTHKDWKTGVVKLSGQWENNPENQLAICGERLVLRKAFPNELGGLYGKEELGTEEIQVETSPSGSLQQSLEKQEAASGPASAKGNSARGRSNAKPKVVEGADPEPSQGQPDVPGDKPSEQQPAAGASEQNQAQPGPADQDGEGAGAGTDTVDVVATRSDVKLVAEEPRATKDDILSVLHTGQHNGYSTGEISEFGVKNFGIEEDGSNILAVVTKTNIAQWKHAFSKKKAS